MSTTECFFDNERSAFEWRKVEGLTNVSIFESAKRVGRTIVAFPPSFIRTERTPSFTIYPDGRAYDFGGPNPRSYSAFQVFCSHEGVDPDAPITDSRRIEAAKVFWPDRYGKQNGFLKPSKQQVAEQKLKSDLQMLSTKSALRSTSHRTSPDSIKRLTEAWDALEPYVNPCPEFWKWIFDRGFSKNFIDAEIGTTLFPLHLPKFPSLAELELFEAAGLLNPAPNCDLEYSPFFFGPAVTWSTGFQSRDFRMASSQRCESDSSTTVSQRRCM